MPPWAMLSSATATPKGHSRLVKLGEIDDFPVLVSQGPLGQLVTTGVVDRFIKSPITPEERKQRAMSWLASFLKTPVPAFP